MKRVVSISLGSSHRDHAVEVELLGERVRIERIGTDGDMRRAQQMYRDLDGQVDAFGVGGTDLALRVDDKSYPLYSVLPLVAGVKETPVVDGGGLKHTLERRVMQVVEAEIGTTISPKTARITSAADRFGMAQSFADAGTTTAADVETLRKAGVRYLATTTPRLEGRTFGTNVMEACLVALAGLGRPLTDSEIEAMLQKLNLRPTVQAL